MCYPKKENLMYIPWEELEKSFFSAAKTLTKTPLSELSHQMKVLWDRWAITRWQKNLRAFQPKVRLFIEKDSYIIKTVESSWELAAVLRLRHEVFFQELLGNPAPGGLDMDEFDLACDHLIIIDKKTKRTVGTYRVMSSTFSKSFYSAHEFDIAGLLALPGNKLELGRACIHKDYRNGLVIALLWRGIHRYAQAVEAHTLFGCSSVQTTDLYTTAQVCAYLRVNEYTMKELDLYPQPSYQIPEFPTFAARYENLDPATLESARKIIPPLLLSYIKSGARVGAEPALDKAFRCVDFMTILETEKLTNTYGKKFVKC
jgi:putative hemolysin